MYKYIYLYTYICNHICMYTINILEIKQDKTTTFIKTIIDIESGSMSIVNY